MPGDWDQPRTWTPEGLLTRMGYLHDDQTDNQAAGAQAVELGPDRYLIPQGAEPTSALEPPTNDDLHQPT